MLSVLVRSVGRVSLGRTLESIAIQDKQGLIVVLVDAKGGLYDFIDDATEPVERALSEEVLKAATLNQLTVRLGFVKPSSRPAASQPSNAWLADSGDLPSSLAGWPNFGTYPFKTLLVSAGRSLDRPTAADLALKIGVCISDLSVFLDDDDTFLEGHLDALEAALLVNEDAVLAHTAAWLTFGASDDIEQSTATKIGRAFEPWELLYGNKIPIHCAVFRTDLIRRQSVSFDAQFERYEDWDFWLQLQSLGRFVWVPGCSARYVAGEVAAESSQVHQLDREDPSYLKIWRKWQNKAPAQWWLELLAKTGPKLDRLELLEQSTLHLSELKESLECRLEQISESGEAKVRAIADLKQALELQVGENRKLHTRLAGAFGEVNKQREEIESQRQHVGRLVAQFEQQESAMRAELSRVVDEAARRDEAMQAELARVVDEAARRDEAMQAELAQALVQFSHREQALLAELTNSQALAEDWRRRSESLATLAGQLQNQLSAVMQSRSWRITAPLRTLGTIARRIGLGKLYRRFRALKLHANLAFKAPGSLKPYSPPMAAEVAPQSEPTDQSQPSISEAASALIDLYKHWIRHHENNHFEVKPLLSKMASGADGQFADDPVVSIVMPIFNPPLNFFKEAIASVKKQSYPNWELCIADDASTNRQHLVWLKQEITLDSRVKLIERSENGHIVACSNSALALATGDWVALMDQDDLLSPHAILEVRKAIAQFPDAMLFYSDEDKINSDGLRSDPYFKPAFNLELLRAQNTFSHLGVFRRSLVNSLGGFQAGTEGSQDHDLVLRCIEQVNDDQVIHIPKVLYHWRIHEQSTASAVDAKPYAVTNGLKAVNNHLKRTTPDAEAVLHHSIPHYLVRYPLPLELPTVDVIIPTRNGFDVLSCCLESLFKLTQYPRMRVTVVDNGSDDVRVLNLLDDYKDKKLIDVLHYDRPFNFSAINNFAVSKTTADHLLFLNNDIEAIRPDWLEEMVRHACREKIGAVGPMLWYPDMTMQHAGVVIGAGGVAGHAHHRLPFGHPGYFGRAAFALEVSAVTAACLLMPRKVFLEVGGFDGEALTVAFNDVDLCLKVRRLGYKVIFTPRAELIHHESATRGNDLAPEHRDRFARECEVMKRRWAAVINNDPSYNPNLEIMTSTFKSFCEPRDCKARSNQLPGLGAAV